MTGDEQEFIDVRFKEESSGTSLQIPKIKEMKNIKYLKQGNF